MKEIAQCVTARESQKRKALFCSCNCPGQCWVPGGSYLQTRKLWGALLSCAPEASGQCNPAYRTCGDEEGKYSVGPSEVCSQLVIGNVQLSDRSRFEMLTESSW